MARFPIAYEVSVAAGSLSAGPSRPPIAFGPPPEFGGDDLSWSPEHLLVSAAAACFTATFAAIAKRAELAYEGYACRATGILERSGFTSVALAVEVKVAPGDVERAQKLLADAKTHCFVANSLKCPVELTLQVGER